MVYNSTVYRGGGKVLFGLKLELQKLNDDLSAGQTPVKHF
jgi:hypothetical protein